ncbi:hypothetical protein ACHAPU_006255 [Fusarium lateritium]
MATRDEPTYVKHQQHASLASPHPNGSPEPLISLTQLYTPPSPHNVHPRLEWAIEGVRKWLYPHLEKLGAEKTMRGIVNETASMCAYLYPNADDEGLFLATGFMTVQFVNDDIFDSAAIHKEVQGTPTAQRLAKDLQKLRDDPQRLADGIVCAARIIQDPKAYDDCREKMSDFSTDAFLLGALHEISTHMHSRGRRTDEKRFEAWLERFCAAMKDFGDSHALKDNEAKNMTVEEYTDHRLQNSGMKYTVLFMEMATGAFLSDEQSTISGISQMKQHCEQIGCLLNEIFSYEKETGLENTNNLLAIMMRLENISLHEASRRVAATSQRHAQEVKRLKEEIGDEYEDGNEGETGLRSYVTDLELFGAACWFWQLQGTNRYSSKTSPFVELRLENMGVEEKAAAKITTSLT